MKRPAPRSVGALPRLADFRLRPAEPSDFEFIWRLRVATMQHMIEAAYGWDEATQRAYAQESLGGMIVLVGERAPAS